MTKSSATRRETDSFGAIDVPAERLWGAQTQRSLENFPIGEERMPRAVIHALGLVKQAAALTNEELGLLPPPLAQAIAAAAAEVAAGGRDDEFPLKVWQTGSGTQTNMNVNEVIANLANEKLGGRRGDKSPVHPNDHVNLGQSSNDSFPSAMHISAALAIRSPPAAGARPPRATRSRRRAPPSPNWSRSAAPICRTRRRSRSARNSPAGRRRSSSGARGSKRRCPVCYALAQGATAVGTGFNADPRFAELFARRVAALTGLPFVSAANKFEAIAAHDALVFAHGALTSLAAALYKIACDIRLLGSGPRSGFAELRLPENEPGSSIMPGKVNPTQVEALCMVCVQTIGNGTIVAFADSQGHLELNALKPLIINADLQSIGLVADAVDSFVTRCVVGIEPDRARIDELMRRSLMLATALTPAIGYDRAAAIAKAAHHNGTTLREEALKAGVDAATFDRLVRPEAMVGPK